MTDRRCGTCRHWNSLNNGWGRCSVLEFGNCRGEAAETPAVEANCPGWSQVDDYSRGWRDAIAAAVKLVGSKTCSDCDGLSQVVETIQPPGNSELKTA